MGIEEAAFALPEIGSLLFGGGEAAAAAAPAAAEALPAIAGGAEAAAPAIGATEALGGLAGGGAGGLIGEASPLAGVAVDPGAVGSGISLGEGASGAGGLGDIGGASGASGLGAGGDVGLGSWDATVNPATPAGGFQDFGLGDASAAGGLSPQTQAGALGAQTDIAGSAPAGGGGFKIPGVGDVSGSTLLKYGIPAGLAATGLLHKSELPKQAGQIQGLAGLESQMAQTDLSLAAQGKITPAQQAQIDIYRQNAMNQLRQQFASAGRTNYQNDSSYLQGVQQIEQQATAMQQQYIDSLIKNGLAAAGGATQALNQVAQMQIQEDSNFQTAIGNAMKAFGYASGAGGLRLV